MRNRVWPLLTALALLGGSLAAQPEDVVQLVRGVALKGRIVEITDDKLRLRVSLAGGAGSTLRTISMEQVKGIDFAPMPGEVELIAAGEKASKGPLTTLWARKRPLLGQPSSNAGALGLQLGKVLLNSADPSDHANARDLYRIIETGDWDLGRRALAKRGRLHALVRVGAAAEVLAEARQIAEESDDPGLLLDAQHVLAMQRYQQLEELVEDNPKWFEDERLGPQVEALYHDLLDRFLYPFLFYGTESAAATRGLWQAAATYRLIGQPVRAEECYADLEKLYPNAAMTDKIDAAVRQMQNENHESTHPKKPTAGHP